MEACVRLCMGLVVLFARGEVRSGEVPVAWQRSDDRTAADSVRGVARAIEAKLAQRATYVWKGK